MFTFRFGLIIALLSGMLAVLVPIPSVLASGNAVGPFIWNAQIFNNSSLTGTPVIIRLDQGINFNWGMGSPGLGIPNDYFSARWTTTANLAAGILHTVISCVFSKVWKRSESRVSNSA
ncbi:MAG: hypothetical protein JXA10_17640 [Anaerolineae bacterium]|nr:hypothetical protein [Anaerolineae bacterium]